MSDWKQSSKVKYYLLEGFCVFKVKCINCDFEHVMEYKCTEGNCVCYNECALKFEDDEGNEGCPSCGCPLSVKESLRP